MSETQLAIVLGTRPEIIKLAPVVRACEDRNIKYTLIHTGQHYSDELDSILFERLELPTPDHHLEVGSGRQGEQTAAILMCAEEVLLSESPDVVVVQGDTNSVLAGAIATSKLDMELAHVEAGLRSFDREMPEEINRILTDHIGDYLFAPTEESANLLRDEGIDEDSIYVTGNTIVDAVQDNRSLAVKKSTILDNLSLTPNRYILMTAHRAENVDDPNRLASILEGANRVAAQLAFSVVYPVHPRTRDRLNKFDITVPENIILIDSVDFLDFLRLEDEATLVITDSGGVQEESCILGTPCVTVRDTTERPETVSVGANVVVGTDPKSIVNGARRQLGVTTDWTAPFGDGAAAERIINIILQLGESKR